MIDAFLAERRNDLIELVRELVAARSPSPPGDERAAAAVAVERLRSLGFTDVDVVGAEPKRPNVLVRVGDGSGPTLLLNGHLDTKPPGDVEAWRTPPWEPTLVDGSLAGLGSADMKGAVAAMIYAAAAVAEHGGRGTLVLALTADEEAGGVFGAAWLASQGLVAADACVIGEPSGIRSEWEAIRLVSRGAAIFRVRVHGTQMHSSLSDELPATNASVQLARLMTRMDRERRTIVQYEPHALVPNGPTFNVGLTVAAGLGYGIHPGEGEFLSDVRALPGMTREGIEADLRAFLEQARADEPALDAELDFDHWTPPSEISAEHPIVGVLEDAAERVLGRRPPLAGFPGGTDAPYFDRAGIPTVPSFGPGLLTAAHTPNESIPVESILQAARIYAHAARGFLDA